MRQGKTVKGSVPVTTVRESVQAPEKKQTAAPCSQTDAVQDDIIVPSGNNDAEKRPQGQSQGSAHAKQTDAKTMKFLGNDISDDRSRSRAYDPDAYPGDQSLSKQRGQGINQKKRGDACGIEH